MSENAALIIQFIIFGLSGLGALAAGVFYAKTNGQVGGVIFVILAITTFVLGGNILDVTNEALR